MSIDIRKRPEADSLKLPIPLYVSVPIADADKDGERFLLVAGLSTAQVVELKAHSLDEGDSDIQSQTSDRKRFGEGSYEVWYAKNRIPFALVHEPSAVSGLRARPGKLAALAWFGPEMFEGAPALPPGKEWHTVAYRSYVPFRGKGLMKGFARFTMGIYLACRPEAVLWAGIHADNAASIGLAEALGFRAHPDSVLPNEAEKAEQKIMVRM